MPLHSSTLSVEGGYEMKGFVRELADRVFRHTRSAEVGSEAPGTRRPKQTPVQHAREIADRLPPRDEGFVWVWQHWHH
jgi:hypothetical protein